MPNVTHRKRMPKNRKIEKRSAGAGTVTIAHGGRAVMSSPSIRRDKGAKHMSAQVNHASVSDRTST